MKLKRKIPKDASASGPEGSAEGISFLTTRSVYDWRKKPYHHGDGTTSKRWKRRSRLVAGEFAFAEGKRDGIFSLATSGREGSVKRKKQEREKEHFLKC